ncbi:alkaline phosphatase family protein [Aliivibrio sp. S4TY2]|uniref:alkaline phosphatase family protein n=1 Tax=unclassified Aliivibrio TaxID=2645654 RepID=UPI002378F404|nr:MULTISPECIES: alkaline phosphatase family protein [unclassified Aliivibrio]MDD9155670.1 alkaline phosphatase family protein [Aliivibrio sp. S4TY2]MDD9160537.1 alkaline phosphatase family protein [Aliivibrio sp. S4TY1]MDD9164565.1 alkaline phosphatase family protein [Aliivibrio sp. S4MY2]MDD9168371.1 alkaline phosphatase family protein [Aliivibrio sp. S4MY4]MDD9184899.1 alkaline phosphatase family protein [Aliivibrio sp. S4MY3]
MKYRLFSSIFTLSVLSLSMLSANSSANASSIPVVGGVVNSAEILKNQIHSSVIYTTEMVRDAAIFTIAGITLDAYILSLPLDADVKKNIIAKLSNPSYAIPLGHFLYTFVDKYGDMDNEDAFKAYLKTQYDEETLNGFSHSLFTLNDVKKEEKPELADSHHQGLNIDRKFIANMVIVYDELVQIGEWKDLEVLPERYTYLSDTPEDRKIIDKIQPIIIAGMTKAVTSMDEGEMRGALEQIIEEGKPEHKGSVNNKAEALTITLIDFVRLNVLKSYRQFVYQEQRQEVLNKWLQESFKENPEAVIAYLESRQQRRLAVQITVDGLQQGLLEGLMSPIQKPFIKQVYQDHLKHETYKPQNEVTTQPEHEQQLSFLKRLTEKEYNDSSYLPFFTELYQNYDKSIINVGISSTPTISVRNLPIIKTGAKVSGKGGTGIPNFHFVDRQEDRAYYFFGNDALQLDRLMDANKVQTMFDRLDYLVTLNCNAQYDWNAHTTYDGLVNLGAGESLRDFGEKRCLRELTQRSKVEKTIVKMRSELIDDIRVYDAIFALDIYSKLTQKWKIQQNLESLSKLEQKGMPDYALIYNPWPDHFAHFTGPFSDEILMPTGELNRLDYWLTQFTNTYKEAGVYDRTLWGMAGDHGLSPVYYSLNPEKQVFDSLQTELGYPLVVKKISSDEGEGPKITNALNYESNKEVDVVVASTAGGNFMMDFFNSAEGWKVQPTYAELTTWTPVNAQKGGSINVVNEIASRLKESLDYLVVRETNCTLDECKARIIGFKDGVRVDELISKKGNRLFYRPVIGSSQLLELDILNPYKSQLTDAELASYQELYQRCMVSAVSDNVRSWCTEQEWRELTAYTARPDSVNQLAKLYEEDRAGTINLFPKFGVGFNTKVPGRHAGEHYLEKDAFLGFWGTPVGANALELKSNANGSLAPTLYEYLTTETVIENEDGWGFSSLLSELDIQKSK